MIVLVWTATPFAVHTTVKASPSSSDTLAVSVTGVPLGPAHSAVVEEGQTTVGKVSTGISWPRISPAELVAVPNAGSLREAIATACGGRVVIHRGEVIDP